MDDGDDAGWLVMKELRSLHLRSNGYRALASLHRDIKHNNNDFSPHRHKYWQCNEFIPYLGPHIPHHLFPPLHIILYAP